ncbi:pyruvate dehydrogenase (acetyl-transferring) E1 component subunit alpha [bacterium]|nr:pyruvate dehydrogenase (acetyl-transferring) E1 component subunit alpha [bacterium]
MPSKVIARFDVSYLQILDENGKVDKGLEPKLPREKLLEMYRVMMRARRLDERLLKMQRQGRVGTLPVSVGQEASSGAAAMAMAEEDWFVGSYREVAGRIAMGEEMHKPMLIYGGFEEGNYNEDIPRLLPLAVILGSQIPHAVGIAYASKLRGEKSAVLAFNGDGAASEGDWHEALNFASVWKSPSVFVVQNNHWAISTPLSKQMNSETIAQRGIAYGMPCLQVDGNDALAVYKATKEALDRARKGEGPTLIEALTYRMLMHTTADDPKKYRSDEEAEEWKKRDPITRFKIYLQGKKLWNDKKEAELEEEIKQEIDAAVKYYENFKEFKLDQPFDHQFGTEVASLVEQRAEYNKYAR